MSAPTNGPVSQPIEQFAINIIGLSEIRGAFSDGIRDFGRRPLFSAFFGAIYAAFGMVFVAGMIKLDQIWMVVPAAIGFPLIAPFLAAGLYEMSRRYEIGEDFTWHDIFLIIFRQQRREFGWMAFVVLLIFWVWIYQVRLLLAMFLQWYSFSTLGEFLQVLSTPNGTMFLMVGSIVGAFLATILFSLTVIAMPLLLDRDVDFLSAMALSIKSVLANPLIMLVWGVAAAGLIFLALLPLFFGLIVILPILGHATWHLYRRVIGPVESKTC